VTDATAKTYGLTGDTSALAAEVGHKVRLWGNLGSSGGGDITSPRRAASGDDGATVGTGSSAANAWRALAGVSNPTSALGNSWGQPTTLNSKLTANTIHLIDFLITNPLIVKLNM